MVKNISKNSKINAITWDKISKDTLINSDKNKITLDEMRELTIKDLAGLEVYLELSLVTKGDDAAAIEIIKYNIQEIKNYFIKTRVLRKMDKQKNIIIGISSIFLLLAGFDGWPYDFFVLLRFVVCASGVYLAWLAHKASQEKWIWAYGIIAVLFNPFFPLHFGRSAWAIIDIATAIFLIISAFLFRPAAK